MKADAIFFDFSGTLVKMRPATLLVARNKLRRLAKKYKLFIITGAQRSETTNIIRKLNLQPIFPLSSVISREDTQLRKPDPKLLKYALNKFCVKNPIYIGDSQNDAIMTIRSRNNFVSADLIQKNLIEL